jgi:PAS domain S-box-containing protein
MAMLGLVFRWRWLALGLAGLASILSLVLSVSPLVSTTLIPDGWSIKPLVSLVTVLIGACIVSATCWRRNWWLGGPAGIIVLLTGLFSLMSHWDNTFGLFTLGERAEASLITGPMIMLAALVLPFLGQVFHQKEDISYRGVIAVGIGSILVTTFSWHLLRLQHTDYLLERAESLADTLETSSTNTYAVKLALIQRLAERWEVMGGMPPRDLWKREVTSYLRDFPELRLIAIFNPEGRPKRIESRAPKYLHWLEQFLDQPGITNWINHVAQAQDPHLSKTFNADDGEAHAAIVVPINPESGVPWAVIAMVDLTLTYETLTQHIDPEWIVTITSHGHPVLDTAPSVPPESRRLLASRDVEAHHGARWNINISIPENRPPPGELYLPPLLLFGGLGLSFLVMLSHQFWQESERRSQSLQRLNTTLNFHLHQERALRQTNERILEFSRDILCSISRDGRFLQISPACELILGYHPEVLLGTHFHELLVQEDRAPSDQEIDLLVSGDHAKTSGFRNRMIHRDGQIVTISWSAEWSEEEQALFCVGRDISDQLVAETLTRERDQFFSLSPDMFCIVDLNTHFFETNNTFVETLGYSRDDLIGTSYMDIVHPDDHPQVIQAVQSLIEGHDVFELLIRVIDRLGANHWLNINAILSADDLIYVVARDTTEQRRIEQKLRENEALLKMAERVAMIGGWVVDLETGKSTWSDAVCTIHDLAPGQAPDVNDAINFYVPEHRERIRNAVQTTAETGIPFDEDLQIRTAEGRLRWVRAIGHAVKDDTGKIVGLQGAFQDITASRQAREELERSNRELQDFAFVASHDLQEPLRKIQAFSDRLVSRSEHLDEQEKDYLRRMQSAAGRMQNLIEDLLTYSRVTTRAKPMVSCDTGRIFQEVLQDMETTIARENAQIHIGELPDTFGDATQLRQVFQNLLSNAIKFHEPEQRPEISVTAESIDKDQWTLVVSDQGIGFDERYADKLFHPFQRLHQKNGFAGTGIGMAIVKKILDRHGAQVSVKSQPGQGTTFRIRFSRG